MNNNNNNNWIKMKITMKMILISKQLIIKMNKTLQNNKERNQNP